MMSKSSRRELDERLADLDEAKAAHLRYRKMIGAMGVGAAICMVLIALGGVMSTLGMDYLAIALIIPAAIVGVALGAGFITRVVTANEKPYGEVPGYNHPARLVSRAQRAYNLALSDHQESDV